MPPLPMEKLPIVRAADLHRGSPPPRQAQLGYSGLAGRLVEVFGGRGTAGLTFLCSLILEAQARGEPVVWVVCGDAVFFPPDVAANGVDLASLAVVRATGIREASRAVHHLLHSGAFGMVILDAREEVVPQGILGRFAHLAERHGAALVCLTERELGSMVSLRLKTRLRRLSPGVFRCDLDVAKDKRLGPTPSTALVFHGPPGLC